MANPKSTRRPLGRFPLILPVIFVGLAFAGELWLRNRNDLGSPFLIFYSAVLLSAWLGGFASGLTATFLSNLVVFIAFKAGVFRFIERPSGIVVHFSLFTLCALFISAVCGALKRSVRIARERNVELEREMRSRRESETALIRSEEFKTRVLDSSLDCIKIIDLNGRLVSLNEGGRDLMEICDFQDFVGKEWVTLWPTQHQPDVLNALNEALAGRTARFIGFCPTAKGTPKWWDVAVSPILDPDGKPDSILSVSRDITQFKLHQDQILEGQQRWSGLAENLSVLVWISDNNGNNIYMNQAFNKFLGIEGRTITAQEWVPTLHPDEQQRVLNKWESSIREGVPFASEHRVRRADGAYRWMLLRATPIRNTSGEITQWVGSATDIDDQRRLVGELRKSKDQLEVILRGVTDGIVVLSPQGKFIYANLAGARLCGFNEVEEFLRAPMAQVLGAFEIMDESGQPVPESNLPGRMALKGVANPPELLVKFRVKESGVIRWSIVSAAPIFDDNGEVLFAVSIFRDFTERKNAEDGLRLLAEASMLFSSSLDYRTILQSIARIVVPSFADWCCISLKQNDSHVPSLLTVSHADPLKQPWVEEYQKKYPPDWNAARGPARVFKTGEPELLSYISDEMIQQSARNPEHLEVLRGMGMRSAITVPLKSRRGVIGTVMLISSESARLYTSADLRVAEDLAARAAMAVENSLLYQEAQSAIQSRDEFMSIASHELRTPLTSLSLLAQYNRRALEKGQSLNVGQALELLNTLERQTVRLSRLVDDMLDISRMATGRLKLERDVADIKPVIEEILQRLAPQLLASGCEVTFVAEAEPRAWVDRQRLEQIVTNLLTNAMKYAPRCRVVVELSVASGSFIVKVHDHGPGISPSDQKRIFDRFERAVSANEVSGLGLGLYIVRQIVELHGGTIGVESELGQGSEFTVRMPLGLENFIEQNHEKYLDR